MVHIGNSWDKVLEGEFDKEYYQKLRRALAAEYSGNIEEMREDVSKTLSELRRIGALSD